MTEKKVLLIVLLAALVLAAAKLVMTITYQGKEPLQLDIAISVVLLALWVWAFFLMKKRG